MELVVKTAFSLRTFRSSFSNGGERERTVGQPKHRTSPDTKQCVAAAAADFSYKIHFIFLGRGQAPPQTTPHYFTKFVKRASFDANQILWQLGSPTLQALAKLD